MGIVISVHIHHKERMPVAMIARVGIVILHARDVDMPLDRLPHCGDFGRIQSGEDDPERTLRDVIGEGFLQKLRAAVHAGARRKITRHIRVDLHAQRHPRAQQGKEDRDRGEDAPFLNQKHGRFFHGFPPDLRNCFVFLLFRFSAGLSRTSGKTIRTSG